MQQGTHHRLASSAMIALLLLASFCIGSPALAQSTASIPVDGGDLVTTHHSGFTIPGNPASGLDTNGPVLSLIDASIPAISPNPTPTPGTAWNPPIFNNLPAPSNEQWLAKNLGQVFGLCMDVNGATPNIYVAASTAYGDISAFPFPNGGTGPGGLAGIYKIDGVTGAILPWVVTGPGGVGTNQIPNGRPALGNICYDSSHSQFFVTNFEDGLIYRIDGAGIILSTYDPFAPTVHVPATFAPLGDRPYAVQVYNGRLYFSGWLRDSGRPGTAWPASWGPTPLNPNNSVFSIALDSTTGDFSGTEQLEIVVPYLPSAQHSNPVADISFSDTGEMLLGERTYAGDFGMIDVGHQGRVLEYILSGTWGASPMQYWLGTMPSPGLDPNNCAGGVDYDCMTNVWSTGDHVLAGLFGLALIPNAGNTPATAVSASYEIPLPNLLKAGPGDVERFRRACGCLPPHTLFCEVIQGQIVLNWSNGQIYDSIEIRCGGVTVATLPGNATNFSMPATPPVDPCCEVVGIVLSPNPSIPPTECSTHCCDDVCDPPINVACDFDPAANAVFLSWTNMSAYDQIEIECNGVIVATLPGTDTTYVNSVPAGSTSNCYRVIGVINGPAGTAPTRCPSEECCVGCSAPSNLICELINMQLVLNWTNTSTYDQINVICNGVLVATLPGSATSHTLATPPTGQTCCQVVGVVTDAAGNVVEECFSEECCIGCTAPANLICELINMQLVLNWTNTSPYSQINVICDGVIVATLSGTATSHTISPPPPGQTCCQVVGVITDAAGNVLDECFSEECCLGCDSPFNVTCTVDPLTGAIVLNWTNPHPYDQINIECNGVIVGATTGTATTFSHMPTPPVAGQICCRVIGVINNSDGTHTECPSEVCCTGCEAPTNVFCELINMQWVLHWTNAAGGYDAIHVYCNGTLEAVLGGGASMYTLPTLPSGQVCCYVVGIINDPFGGPPTECPSVECCLGCEEPINVTCTPGPANDVILNWTNGSTYDQIEIICNGTLVATLPGTATFHVTPLPTTGQICCQVVGVINGPAGTPPTRCPSLECCLGCEAPTNVDCEFVAAASGIVLSWTNPQVYTSIQVWCDGFLVSTEPGTATSYTHAGGSPGDTICCWLVGVVVDSTGVTTECISIECCAQIPDDGPCPREDVVVLLNTGYDDGSASVIGVGNPDDDWIVVGDRDLSNNALVPPFSTTPEPTPAEVRTTHAAWGGPLVGPGATGSAWVFHSINSANGYFDYQRCFCLREGFSNASLSFEILADDQADVFLNGTLIFSTGPAAFVTPQSHVEIDQSLFHAGENCIMVTVANTFGVATGFNFVGEVTADDAKCCCTAPPAGMVGWWPLDVETSSTGGGSDIAWGNNGSVVIPDFQPGKVAEALFFNGSNQVVVNDHPRLDFGPPTGINVGDFSIDAWIRLDNSIAGPHPIVSKFSQTGTSPGYIFYVDANGHLSFIVQDNTIASAYNPVSAAAFVNDGQWHHVAVTYDRDRTGNGVRLFVDGARVDPDTFDGTAMGDLSNNGALRIGGSLFFGGTAFEGHIDEVEIFDRVLLASEVRRLYEAGENGKCKEYCHVPWDKPVASGGTATVNAVVCNDGGTTQTYTVTAMPHSGPGCTLGSPSVGVPATVSVPPGSCITVPLSILAPTGPGISCYKVCFENILTGHKFCCAGSMRVGSPIIVISDDDIISVPVGAFDPVIFTVTNPGTATLTFDYAVFGMTMNPAVNTLSLDGLPPGEPVRRSLTLGAGETGDIAVEARVVDHEPFVFYDIILMVDMGGGNGFEAEASSMLRTSAAAPPQEFVRGDCNSDGNNNIGDPVFLLGYLFGGGVLPSCPDACDSNDDANLNIGDAVYKLSHLFAGGPTPAAPFPSCGVDPTPDTLGSCVDPNCP